MKGKIFTRAFIALGLVAGLAACKKSDQEKRWDNYEDWRVTNEAWFHEKEVSGDYTKVVPAWNTEQKILMRWLNDTTLTSGNLIPLYSSTVTVKYRGWLYDGTPFDSSYNRTDSVVTFGPSTLMDGWIIALEKMHVGDKVELIVPYTAAYGGTGYGSSVPPYSSLGFEVELKDVPTYEIPGDD